jgi:hypothetical protein
VPFAKPTATWINRPTPRALANPIAGDHRGLK